MRPLGALFSPDAKPRGQPFERLSLMRASGDLSESVDLRAFAERYDQEDEGCTGHAFGGAIEARASMSSIPLRVSRRAIYTGARELENPKLRRLPDVGAYPELALDWLEMYGVVDSARFPEDGDVELRVGQDVLEAGSSAVVTGTYRIDSAGETKRDAMMRAMNAWHLIPFAMNVGASYEAYRGGLWSGPPDGEPKKGGHMQFAAGYTPEGVYVVNSWGGRTARRPWGDDGTALIAWPWALANFRSLFVVTFVPTEAP